MTAPKPKPCPDCKTDDKLIVFKYDNGFRHVECLACNYLGPGEGSVLAAIRSHNANAAGHRFNVGRAKLVGAGR